MQTTLVWFGILFCVSQSAMFSGLNLAFFSITKLRLEIESQKQNPHALKVTKLRENSNFLLTTILWGNVGINVLLTLLSNSVMAGMIAFIFSTFVITFLGEIIPQAYFSRHALKTASLLAPAIRIYQVLLFPVAKPSAMVLDKWLGPEAIQFFQERDLRTLLKLHIKSGHTDIAKIEGKGALNFLAIDDLPVMAEGESVDPKSVIRLPFEDGRPRFPEMEPSVTDPFLIQVQASQKKWVVITDPAGEPRATLNADGFLRAALFDGPQFNPRRYCHRPIVVRDAKASLGVTIPNLTVHPERSDDDVIDRDIILFWGRRPRIITGSDILGRLLRGIVQQQGAYYKKDES